MCSRRCVHHDRVARAGDGAVARIRRSNRLVAHGSERCTEAAGAIRERAIGG